jgi:hypothetical protein
MLKHRASLSLALVVALAGANSPARADFWDDAFGGASFAPPIAAPFFWTAPDTRYRHHAWRRHDQESWSHSGHRQHASRPKPPEPEAAQPIPQHFNSATEAAAAAKADETLQPGDIVSSDEGLLVYVGDANGDGHDNFVSARDKHVKARLRKLLSAYAMPDRKTQPTRNAEPYAKADAAPALQAIQNYVSDSHGKRIRFVGGKIPAGE